MVSHGISWVQAVPPSLVSWWTRPLWWTSHLSDLNPSMMRFVGFADHRKTKYSSNITSVRILASWLLGSWAVLLEFSVFLVSWSPMLLIQLLLVYCCSSIRKFFCSILLNWGSFFVAQSIYGDWSGLTEQDCLVDLVWLVVGTMNLPYDWRKF